MALGTGAGRLSHLILAGHRCEIRRHMLSSARDHPESSSSPLSHGTSHTEDSFSLSTFSLKSQEKKGPKNCSLSLLTFLSLSQHLSLEETFSVNFLSLKSHGKASQKTALSLSHFSLSHSTSHVPIHNSKLLSQISKKKKKKTALARGS